MLFVHLTDVPYNIRVQYNAQCGGAAPVGHILPGAIPLATGAVIYAYNTTKPSAQRTAVLLGFWEVYARTRTMQLGAFENQKCSEFEVKSMWVSKREK